VSTDVVILGAGFGGLELSSRLSAELADEVHVTLIDQSDSFIFVVDSGLTAFRRDRWFGPGSSESLPDGTTPDSPSPHEESHDHHLA
jgi:hypothetical protein